MEETGLVKKMNFWHIWALGVGSVVGDGIFLMVAQGAQAAGPSASMAYLIAGLLLMAVCMAISEMAVGMPGAGSLHTWSKRILGPAWGTIAGLGETLMNIIFLGSVSLATGAISNYFFMWGDNPATSALIWALILLSIVVAIALMGGEITGVAQLILVIVLVAIMAVFAIGGLLSGKIQASNYTPFAPFGVKGMWVVLGMGVYAYMGPLSLLTAGGEVKKITHLPRAMFWAFVTFLILYTGAMLVMLGLNNWQLYGTMESPFTVAAEVVFGKAAGLFINLAAWIAAVTCLIGETFCASRLLFGMSEDGTTPQAFGKLNKKGVPYVGVLFAYVIGLVLIFVGNTAAFERVYVMLANLGCVAGTMCMLVSTISSLRYKTRFPEEWKNLPWHLPMRRVVYVAAFVGIGIILYSLLSDASTLIWSVVMVIALLAYYNLYSKPNIAKKAASEQKTASN